MATTIPCKIHIPFRLPRPLNPTKPPASKTARPANCELVDGRADPSTYPPLLSLKSAAATRPNLHSLNSWPAVQCNEGFCNASEGQRLPLTTTMASQKPHHSANPIHNARVFGSDRRSSSQVDPGRYACHRFAASRRPGVASCCVPMSTGRMVARRSSTSLFATSLETSQPECGTPDLTELRTVVRRFPKNAA